MPPIIEVHDLVKRYRRADRNAVDGVSFAVEPGAFFTLLGPNGAGKTTIVSILTTTLVPTSGTVQIAGRDLAREASAVRREVGIIFQNPSLDLNLSGEENVRFHATLYGLYPFRLSYRTMPSGYRKQVEDLADVLGLGDDLFKPVKTYSGGMKRKLEIVRSLLHRPRVLFLDEPTTGLDPASRHNLWGYLRQVRGESGTTTFLTTHYLEEAEESDRICIVDRGRVVSHGTPAEVKAQLVEEYVLVDADDGDGLRAELTRLGLRFSGESPIKVNLDGRTVHQVAREIEIPLRTFATHTPSIEDAYLEIVGRSEVEGMEPQLSDSLERPTS